MAFDSFILPETVNARHFPGCLKWFQCVDKNLLNKAAKTNMQEYEKFILGNICDYHEL